MRFSLGEEFIGNLDKLRSKIHRQRNRLSPWLFVMGVGAGVVIVSVKGIAFGANTTVSATSGTTLNIVAHEDDDLLFLSPDLLHAIQAGRAVRTVFVTAGDSGAAA